MSNITGTIRSVLGEAKLLKANGEEVMLKEGDVIASGDTIITGADGSAYIDFPAQDGKSATEGILQSNSEATLDGSNLNVTEGEFELMSEGEDQVVAVNGGGMFGLFGVAAAGGSSAALGAAAGGAFLLGAASDDDDGGAGADSGDATPGTIQAVADTAGPAGSTVEEAYAATGPTQPVTEDPLEAVEPVVDSAEPVLDATAPVTDAAEPVLTPV
ncbi:MAG: hypothetical protein R3194_09995, partial [Limnobacter sp.]|nr:hypothetical protein [Limnobacter sp.]